MANGPCRPDGGLASTGRRACRAVPCLHGLRAWPTAHGTARGPSDRVVPPVGHSHFSRAVPAHSPTTKKHLIFTRFSPSVWSTSSFSPVLNKIPSFLSPFSQKLTDSHSHSPQYHTITNHNTREKTKRQGYMKMMIKRSCFVQCCLIKNLSR